MLRRANGAQRPLGSSAKRGAHLVLAAGALGRRGTTSVPRNRETSSVPPLLMHFTAKKPRKERLTPTSFNLQRRLTNPHRYLGNIVRSLHAPTSVFLLHGIPPELDSKRECVLSIHSRQQTLNLVAVDPFANSLTFLGPMENPLVPTKLKSNVPSKLPQRQPKDSGEYSRSRFLSWEKLSSLMGEAGMGGATTPQGVPSTQRRL